MSHQRHESASESDSPSSAQRPRPRRPLADPFAPDAAVPLPFQIGDEYGYAGGALGNGGGGANTVWRRNERERHRVRCVNDGYEALRATLPLLQVPERRLSKVETLRVAIGYIAHLEALLADDAHAYACTCMAYMADMLAAGAATLRVDPVPMDSYQKQHRGDENCGDADEDDGNERKRRKKRRKASE